MLNQSDYLATAHETLCHGLDSLEQMIRTFSHVFDLDIVARARNVTSQLEAVSGFYSWETWDESGGWPSLTTGLSELEGEMSKLAGQVDELDKAVGELGRIYRQFVLSQAIIMLVSLLEVYLKTVFACLLESRGRSTEKRQYSFQNWEQSVEAFDKYFGIDLCPPKVQCSKIFVLQQKRHVFVHRMGIFDEQAVENLGLPSSQVGRQAEVAESEIMEGIKLVRVVGEHLCSFDWGTLPNSSMGATQL